MIRPPLRQHFATPEQVRHGVAADRTSLLGSDDGLNLLCGQALRAEVAVEFDGDLFRHHVVRFPFVEYDTVKLSRPLFSTL